ncbi:hypothetical protein ACWEJ6_45515, partial [Nonomuraea sp. NPDC004702]
VALAITAFVLTKFYIIFSFLFGYSFTLQMRAAGGGRRAAGGGTNLLAQDLLGKPHQGRPAGTQQHTSRNAARRDGRQPTTGTTPAWDHAARQRTRTHIPGVALRRLGAPIATAETRLT